MADVFDMIATERRALADQLDGLSDAQWEQPTLCDGWRVRDIVAHLVWPTETPLATIMVKMALKGFNFDKLADEQARKDRRSNEQLVGALRANAGSRFKPPGLGPQAPLTDVLVHGFDIRRPLGIDYTVAPQHARTALDFLVSKKAKNGFVARKGLVDGLRLEATDAGWSSGTGPTVAADAPSLMLALTGRRAVLDDLAGDGVDELRRRLD